MELSEIDSPFKPMMAQGEGSPMSMRRRKSFKGDLIKFNNNDEPGIDDEVNYFEDPHSKWSFQGLSHVSRPSILDLSHLSSRSGGSFEGIGGNASILDPTDLQTEISELKFQGQKLEEECANLRQQNAAFQDENIQLLAIKDELEKKLSHRDLAQERIKQLQRELDDARQTILSGEDLIAVQSARIQRLEKDFFELESKEKELNKDHDCVVVELSRCFAKVKQKEAEIERLKATTEEIALGWMEKVEYLENSVVNVQETLEELTRANNNLRKEKFELENNLVDFAGNQLAQLNNHCQVKNADKQRESKIKSCSSSSPEYNRSYLRRSLQAEIAATLFENSFSESLTPTMSTDHREISFGVIPESEKEDMIQYAYDPVRRCSEINAGFLSGPEWRTLRADLDKTNLDNYRKRFAQEEGNDIEGGMAIAGQRPSNTPDLQEEAEEYLESFPHLIEEVFVHLDVIKKSEQPPTEKDLKAISERFNHLMLTFQTNHVALTDRKELKSSEHDIAKNKMEMIINSLSENVQKLVAFTKYKIPEEVTEISDTLYYLFGDLDLYSTNLSKTSRRVGMMDVQMRLYKMVEVMVLYVHILRNLCDEKDKDVQNAKELLAKNDILLATSSKSSDEMINSNNNNDRICWDEDPTKDGETQNSDKPQQILQHLLGPKKSSLGFVPKARKLSSYHNKRLSELYEAIRCEMFWPWGWDNTWKGTKQGFSVLLMIIGIFVIFRCLLPVVSANDPPPLNNLASVFSQHGNLEHTTVPPI